MKTYYEITVTRVVTENKIVPGKWSVIGEEVDEKSSKVLGKYGYAPARKEEVTTKEQIFQQVIGALDLSRLVVAIQQAEDAKGQGLPQL